MRSLFLAAAAILLALPGWAQTPAARPAATPAPAPRSAPATAPAPTTAQATPNRIDVNAAPADRLATLPGIGAARSKAIVDNRPYAELSDLVKKKALPQGVFDKVKDQLALANINTSSAAEMEKTLPGVGDVRAKAIVAGRPYAQPHDLVTKGVLTEAVYAKAKDVIAY